MKLHSLLKLTWMVVAAASLMACVRYHDGYSRSKYNYEPYPKETSYPEMPAYNQTLESLKSSWVASEERLLAAEAHGNYSPRFALELGFAAATAADTINSWKIELDDWNKSVAELKIRGMRDSFEYELYSWAVKSLPQDFDQAAGMIYEKSSQVFFFRFMFITSSLKFVVDPFAPPLRDIDQVTRNAMDAHQFHREFETCYWLGVLAREFEKKNVGTEALWNTCRFDGIHTDHLKEIGVLK